jgi:hypothetical protein
VITTGSFVAHGTDDIVLSPFDDDPEFKVTFHVHFESDAEPTVEVDTDAEGGTGRQP